MTSQWAAKRKLTYSTIIIVVIVLAIGIPTFLFFNKTKTCFDGIKNQNEKGVDCGGVCKQLCPSDIIMPITLWQRSFAVTTGVYNAVAYIQNPNVLMQAGVTQYVFRLYDTNNVVIGERTGSTFIPANQVFAVFEAGIRTGGKAPARTSFSFTQSPVWSQNPSDYKSPNVIAGDVVLSNESSSPRIDAVINNASLKNVGVLEVVAIVYDADDNAMAASRTIVENLSAGSIAPVTFTWPAPFSSAAVRKEIILRTYPAGVAF